MQLKILFFAALALCVSACSAPSGAPAPAERPPRHLLEDCPHPEPADDVAETLARYRRALDACNADKAVLRYWLGGGAASMEY